MVPHSLPGGCATEVWRAILHIAGQRRVIRIAYRVLQWLARRKGGEDRRSRSYVAEALGILERIGYIKRDNSVKGECLTIHIVVTWPKGDGKSKQQAGNPSKKFSAARPEFRAPGALDSGRSPSLEGDNNKEAKRAGDEPREGDSPAPGSGETEAPWPSLAPGDFSAAMPRPDRGCEEVEAAAKQPDLPPERSAVAASVLRPTERVRPSQAELEARRKLLLEQFSSPVERPAAAPDPGPGPVPAEPARGWSLLSWLQRWRE